MLRRVTVWSLAFLLAFGPLGDIARAQVVPDGRTATHVETVGNVTDVTTTTTYGESGINSFTEFSVGQGSVVNLHLPGGASRLVNLVYGGATAIDGVLNAIKDGQVGGKVYILNPSGIAVGEQGTVNVGALTLMTPSENFMNSFFDGSGNFQATALTELYTGEIPIGPSGNITVAGTINAVTDVDVTAQNVNVSGEIVSGASFQSFQMDFSDVINMNGLDANPRITVENGSVRIVAQDSFVASGTINVDGGYVDAEHFTDAGDIQISAGRSIRLDQGSQLSAQGGSEHTQGGRIALKVSQVDDTKTPVYSVVEAETGIFIDGASVKGGDIHLTAYSEADNSWSPDNPEDLARSTVSVLSGITLADVNVIKARAVADVIVTGESVLAADGEVRLSAQSKAGAGMFSFSPSSLTFVDIGVAYGETTARANVQVDGNDSK